MALRFLWMAAFIPKHAHQSANYPRGEATPAGLFPVSWLVISVERGGVAQKLSSGYKFEFRHLSQEENKDYPPKGDWNSVWNCFRLTIVQWIVAGRDYFIFICIFLKLIMAFLIYLTVLTTAVITQVRCFSPLSHKSCLQKTLFKH